MTVATISPRQAQAALKDGALLVDIRDADEHARERIPGAVNVPLAGIASLPAGTAPVVFHCRTGMRTDANAGALREAAGVRPCYLLGGGIEGWRAAGLPTRLDRSQPLEIMRQVQLTAGALVLAGVLLGWFVAPGWFALSGFVGAGLMFAGASGWCGMANLLRLMPWNRAAAR